MDPGKLDRDLRGRHAAGRFGGALQALQEGGGPADDHQAVGARLRSRRLGLLQPVRPVVLADPDADQRRGSATRGNHHRGRLRRGHFGPQCRTSDHCPWPAHADHAADGDRAVHLSRHAAQVARRRGAAVHLRDDRYHALYPRRHRPGLDHDAQGSGAGGALPGAGQPLRRRAQQHVARPVHARSAGPAAGVERALPRAAASAEGAGARRHARLAVGPPQRARRQSPHQEREAGHYRARARPARGQVRPVPHFARRRPHHRGVAPHYGGRRLGRHPGGRHRAQARAGAHHPSRQVRRIDRARQPHAVPRAHQQHAGDRARAAKPAHHPSDRPRPLQGDQRHARPSDRRQAAQGSRVPAQRRHQAGRHDHALRRRRVRGAADHHRAPPGRRMAGQAAGAHAQGAVRDRRPPHRHRRLDRHRHGADRRRQRRRAVEEGRYGALFGQERRRRRPSFLRHGHGGGGAGAPRARARSARRARLAAVPAELSAAGRLAHRPGDDLRGAAALDASRARRGAARGVHPGGRGNRPDHRARRVGLAAGLHRGGELAARRQGRRQPVAGAIPRPRACACRW